MGTKRKAVYSFIGTIVVLYVGVCIYFYAIQNKILFKPDVLSQDHTYSYNFDFEERTFEVEQGISIHAIHAKAPDSTKGLIFFCHGNARSNDTNPAVFEIFLDQGYDVIYPDYRGFGKSGGKLEDEGDLIGDFLTIYSRMEREYDEKDIVVVGYSLGSGVAAQVAAANDPKALMIWTPYYSMVDMKDNSYPFLPSFMLKYPLRTDLALPQVEEPITIFYARNDEILPIDRSLNLTKLLKEGDEYFILENQGHNHVYTNHELVSRLPAILERN